MRNQEIPGWSIMHEIIARPFPFRWEPYQSALLMIDMQKDFVLPGGFGESLGNDVSPLQNIVPACKRVLDFFRSKRLPVIHTLEAHESDLSDCPPSKLYRSPAKCRIGDPGPMGRILIRGEEGNAIVDELGPVDGEKVIHKPGKGAFYKTNLLEYLNGMNIRQLIIAGVTTEVCVQTSMREANDRGFDCLLLEDCTESYFPAFKESAIEMMVAQGGIVGWAADSDRLLESFYDAD